MSYDFHEEREQPSLLGTVMAIWKFVLAIAILMGMHMSC